MIAVASSLVCERLCVGLNVFVRYRERDIDGDKDRKGQNGGRGGMGG